MSEAELATIDDVAASYRRLVKVGCTGCAYCMPCPSGVNIPMCFSLYNDYHMGNSLMARGFYGMMLMGGMGTKADASLCIRLREMRESLPAAYRDPVRAEEGEQHAGWPPDKDPAAHCPDDVLVRGKRVTAPEKAQVTTKKTGSSP